MLPSPTIVCCSFVWASHRSKGIHQGPGDSHGVSLLKGSCCDHLPGEVLLDSVPTDEISGNDLQYQDCQIHQISSLQSGVVLLCSGSPQSILFCMSVLGRMVSTFEAIPYTRFHMRPLQHFILACCSGSSSSLEKRIHLLMIFYLSHWSLPKGHPVRVQTNHTTVVAYLKGALWLSKRRLWPGALILSTCWWMCNGHFSFGPIYIPKVGSSALLHLSYV